MSQHDLSAVLRQNTPLTFGRQVRMVAVLSWPAIMAQISSILMEYIDAAMVGSLGAAPAASIGLVATTTWLFWGLGSALSTGFSVQVAHLVGAGNAVQARSVFRQAVIALTLLGVLLAAIGAAISGPLPHWLGGNEDINADASGYFCVVALTMPTCFLAFMSSAMLRCSGNMIMPGVMNVLMCVLDVVFNFFLIFDSREVFGIMIPGAGLGVVGAAIGTALAQIVVGAYLLWYIMRRSPYLNFKGVRFKFKMSKQTLNRAFGISAPIATERIVMCGAQILSTVIVAPLGTASIAANAFAITAESLCYMPGYGVSDAATTLVGQSLGARRKDLARSFGKITIGMGIVVMTIMGVVMWLCAPLMMSLFTPDEAVRQLGAGALRIEAWAEPMFAASIVAYGVMVGAGYTVVPACLNLASIWAVRLSLAAILAPIMGLNGVWLAMCIELCVRGTAFLITFFKANWMRKANLMPETEIEAIENPPHPYVE